jgi:hypothetical protein
MRSRLGVLAICLGLTLAGCKSKPEHYVLDVSAGVNPLSGGTTLTGLREVPCQ